jgi:hypothetical protein
MVHHVHHHPWQYISAVQDVIKWGEADLSSASWARWVQTDLLQALPDDILHPVIWCAACYNLY